MEEGQNKRDKKREKQRGRGGLTQAVQQISAVGAVTQWAR
jgi:hypothetical protein